MDMTAIAGRSSVDVGDTEVKLSTEDGMNVMERRVLSEFDVECVSIAEILDARRKAMESQRTTHRRRKRGPIPPMSAATFYRQEEIEVVAKAEPTASASEVLSIVEHKWSHLADKTKYVDMEEKDHDRFGQERRFYMPKAAGGFMKRPKKRKHPDAPKHPRSAYLFFAEQERPRVREEFPDMKFTQIAKLLGGKWKALAIEEKKKFEDLAEDDKLRYAGEKKLFHATLDGSSSAAASGDEAPHSPSESIDGSDSERSYPDKSPSSSSSKKERRNIMEPRSPMSSYLYFVATNRSRMNIQYPENSFTDNARLLGILWKQLGREHKRKYEIVAEADKIRYEEEKREWEPPVDESSDADATTSSIHSQQSSAANARRKKPTSAYALWSGSERAAVLEAMPSIDRKELTKILRENWNEMPTHEKIPFQNQAAANLREIKALEAVDVIDSKSDALLPPLEKKSVDQPPKKKYKKRKLAPEPPSTPLFPDPPRLSVSQDFLKNMGFSSNPIPPSLAPSIAPVVLRPPVPAVSLSTPSDVWGGEPLTPTHPQLVMATPIPPPLDQQSRAIGEWGPDKIGRFIADVGFPQYSHAFSLSGLSGREFVGLTTKDLKERFGITNLGERKKIKTAINQLLV